MPMRDTEFDGAVPVDGYGPGFFRVAGQVHHGPVLVTAEGARPWGGLEDVARLVGYQDEKYFASLFKRAFGVTPSQYKKQKQARI